LAEIKNNIVKSSGLSRALERFNRSRKLKNTTIKLNKTPESKFSRTPSRKNGIKLLN